MRNAIVGEGSQIKEVPVTKIYPGDAAVGYTKMRPLVDWWRIFRPLVFLFLGIKK